MEKVDTIVVDKTSTLTEGKPKVTHVLSADGYGETELLTLAASLERASEHPFGVAIVAAANERQFQLSAPSALVHFSSIRLRQILKVTWIIQDGSGIQSHMGCTGEQPN